jgi:hypothetical protein
MPGAQGHRRHAYVVRSLQQGGAVGGVVADGLLQRGDCGVAGLDRERQAQATVVSAATSASAHGAAHNISEAATTAAAASAASSTRASPENGAARMNTGSTTSSPGADSGDRHRHRDRRQQGYHSRAHNRVHLFRHGWERKRGGQQVLATGRPAIRPPHPQLPSPGRLSGSPARRCRPPPHRPAAGRCLGLRG